MPSRESWLKVGIPALPALFAILGVWAYWGENPLPALAPSLAFWGVVVVYYLFTRVYDPDTYAPYWLAVFTAMLWLLSAINSHILAEFIASNRYESVGSLLRDKNFWWAYGCALSCAGVGVWQFRVHEPGIVAQDRAWRKVLTPRGGEHRRIRR